MTFLKDITLGRYIYRESFIHNLDPRVKLISLILIGVGLIFLKGLFPLILLSLFLLYTLNISRIPFNIWYRGYRIFLWFFLIMILFYGWSGYQNSQPHIHWLFRLKNGLSIGLLASVRWAILIGLCSVLTMTTTPSEITRALESLLNPLRKIRFPVHELSIMSGLTMHFLPLLKEETDRLIKAAMAQGIDFNEPGFSKRLHNILGIISPLMQRLYRRSEAVAMAMEARGYSYNKGRGEGKISLSEPMNRKDIWALILVFVFLIAIWSINRFIR